MCINKFVAQGMQTLNVQCMQIKRMSRQLWINFEKLPNFATPRKLLFFFVASHRSINNRCFALKINDLDGLFSVNNSQYHLVKRPWGSQRDTSLFVVRCTTGLRRASYNAPSLDE